jgi:YidC/Oxa1 family membrane protein insertase
MDTKNVIAAISLSAAVIILYTLFFAPETPDPNIIKKSTIEKTKKIEDSDAPNIDQNENLSKLTRKEALTENERIQFENNNIIGSISLKGAIIDDLTFKQ